jgi:hypothetical protein
MDAIDYHARIWRGYRTAKYRSTVMATTVQTLAVWAINERG